MTNIRFVFHFSIVIQDHTLYLSFFLHGKIFEEYNLKRQIFVKQKKSKQAYLIFVIFFTLAKFLENKIYTEKRQFFALNL